MFKKFVFCLLFVIFVLPRIVFASDGALVLVGGKYYDSLYEAIMNASSTDTIKLLNDVSLDNSLMINKTVNLDLNGNDIEASSKVFVVQGGVLNISGKGTIRENSPEYGAIMVIGSDNVNDSYYSVVNISEDVTLEGWSGLFITHDNSKSYGVVINFSGKVNAVSDTAGGEGVGVYVNGNIKDKDNAPVVNIKDGSLISSNGDGIYIAGYGTFNIGSANISGVTSGIAIKSGILNIDGATIVCSGKDSTPTEGYNNGIKPSGASIQIESNNGYAGGIKLNIKGGNIKSYNSNAIYEYIGRGNGSLVEVIDIDGGTFVSGQKKDVFKFSGSLEGMDRVFVSGGKYSTDPSAYLDIGYKVVNDSGMYSVVRSTMLGVVGDGDSRTSCYGNVWVIGLGVVGVVIISMVLYFNRYRLYNLFKR